MVTGLQFTEQTLDGAAGQDIEILQQVDESWCASREPALKDLQITCAQQVPGIQGIQHIPTVPCTHAVITQHTNRVIYVHNILQFIQIC